MCLNENSLHFVKNTSYVYQWKKTELVSFLKYQYGKCGNGEEEQGCMVIGLIIVFTVNLQYIFLLLLVLANDVESNPRPTGIDFVHVDDNHIQNKANTYKSRARQR